MKKYFKPQIDINYLIVEDLLNGVSGDLWEYDVFEDRGWR